jgi:predicted HTH transcriptional regulator
MVMKMKGDIPIDAGHVAKKEAMVAAGLRKPTFVPDAFFRAIFRRSTEFSMKEGPTGTEKRIGEKFGDGSEKSSEKILAYLSARTKASAREIAKAIGLISRAVEKQIAALKAAGRLRRLGPDKGGHWEIYKD